MSEMSKILHFLAGVSLLSMELRFKDDGMATRATFYVVGSRGETDCLTSHPKQLSSMSEYDRCFDTEF